MSKSIVSVVRYRTPRDSVREAVELAGGLGRLSAGSRVFIKPNVVFWTRHGDFPKWGVLTTSRVVEDMVLLLKEHGVRDITIGEGTALPRPNDLETPAHAFRTLGYYELKSRYGVRIVNVFEQPFERVDLGDRITLDFNSDILRSDYVVNLPVLKTHVQTVVSLGIKNLKGMIDFESRKKCHSPDPDRDLHYMVSKLFRPMPPTLTLLDGIYTHERGPNTDGRARRSNLLVASWDILSADMVGAAILGHPPGDVPYIVHAAREMKRGLDLSDIRIVGMPIEDVAALHHSAFPYNESDTLPLSMERMGIRGLTYRKYDLTICTFCSNLNRLMLTALAAAWKGDPYPDVEVLTGKVMRPSPGMRKTILLGNCIYQRNREHDGAAELIPIKGCPPDPRSAFMALTRAGIDVDREWFDHPEKMQEFHRKRYLGKPEFDESFFRVSTC